MSTRIKFSSKLYFNNQQDVNSAEVLVKLYGYKGLREFSNAVTQQGLQQLLADYLKKKSEAQIPKGDEHGQPVPADTRGIPNSSGPSSPDVNSTTLAHENSNAADGA